MHGEVGLFHLPFQLLDGSCPSVLGVVGDVDVEASYQAEQLASGIAELLPNFFEHLPLVGFSLQSPQLLEEDLMLAVVDPLSCLDLQDSGLVCPLSLEVAGHTETDCWDVLTVLSAVEKPFGAVERSWPLEHLAFAEIVDG